MFANRLSELFQFASEMGNDGDEPNLPPRSSASTTMPQLLPIVTAYDIYQMAAAQARYEYELDRLFNPDYYQDGSGI